MSATSAAAAAGSSAAAAADAAASASESQSQGVFLDALPYVDAHDPAMKEQVEAMLQEEMSTLTRTPDEYLAEFLAARGYDLDAHTRFESPMLAAGFAALAAGRPAVPASCIDSSRAALAPPAPEAPLDTWRGAVDQAAIQLELQGTRQMNLELLKKYGSAAWRLHNEQLQAVKSSLASAVDEVRSGSESLNRKRKAEQVAVGSDLALLDSAFYSLVQKNHQIELACQQLQTQIDAQPKAKQRA